jgi:hypothetical protein
MQASVDNSATCAYRSFYLNATHVTECIHSCARIARCAHGSPMCRSQSCRGRFVVGPNPHWYSPFNGGPTCRAMCDVPRGY